MSRVTSAGPSCSPGRKGKVIPRAGRGDRVALLHFTIAPAIGGIERLIAAQCEALTELGCRVRLIAGSGWPGERAELTVIPEMQPPPACEMWPADDHPAVERLYGMLRSALQRCDQCWIHNALTVYLNPFLTVALLRLIHATPAIRWVAWCEDISALSAFRQALPGEPNLRAIPGVTYVTISHARQQELARLLSLQEEEILVISPPLEGADWLELGDEARQIVESLRLWESQPVVLVPAKLLPHKNLGLTVQVAAVLRQMAARPLILLSGAASPHEQPVSAALQHRIACVAGELGVTANLHLLPEITGGAPEGRTIRDLMLLSDLVFLPSAEEGFGMPVQEAAALRAPVLCSDIPAFREIGRDFARFFPLDSTPEHIAACIMAISGSPLNRARRQAVFSAVRFRSQLQALVGEGQ